MAGTLAIDAGDTVRLIDGREVVVDSVSTWYEDREGRHDGPWALLVSPDGFENVHFDEVEYVVSRNEHRCVLCGSGVTAKDPEKYPYCRACHYTGNAAEQIGADAWAPLREAFPEANVTVEHTGGGCFWLAVYFPDDKGFHYAMTNGEASLPEEDGAYIRNGWGYVGRHYYDYEADPNGEHPDYNGTPILEADGVWDSDGDPNYWEEYPAHCLTDEQVIEAIRQDRKSRGF